MSDLLTPKKARDIIVSIGRMAVPPMFITAANELIRLQFDPANPLNDFFLSEPELVATALQKQCDPHSSIPPSIREGLLTLFRHAGWSACWLSGVRLADGTYKPPCFKLYEPE